MENYDNNEETSDDCSNFYIKMRVQSQTSFKAMCEIWDAFAKNNNSPMIFYENGILISCINPTKTTACEFQIFSDHLLFYNYSIGNNKMYPVFVNPKKMISALKGKDKIYFTIDINRETLYSSGIMFLNNGEGYGGILIQIERGGELNNFSILPDYKKTKPFVKLSIQNFSKIIKNLKTGCCNYAEIRVEKDGLVKCLGYTEVGRNAEVVESLNETYDLDDVSNVNPLSFLFKMKDNDWLNKMKGISHDCLVLLYIYDSKLLIIEANIGSFGVAKFGILPYNANS